MIKIINLTDRKIDIHDNLFLKPRGYLELQMNVTPQLYKLMNLNIIKIQEVKDNNKLNSNETKTIGMLRRQQTLEKIRRGEITPSISLDVSKYAQDKSINKSKNKRTKSKNN